MGIGNGVVIRFLADTGSAIRDISKLERATGRSMGKMGKASAIWSKAGPALAAGAAAGVAAFTAVAVEGVQAAVDQEKANARLARTLKNLGLEDSTDLVLDQVDAMQKLYGVSEDDLLPAFGKVVGVTKDTGRAMELLRAGLDLAAGTGRPLEAVMTAIAKAAGEGGSTGALKRLAPELNTVGLEAGDAAELMKRINKQFGGQAADNAKTMSGTMDRFGIHVGEVNEALGKGLISGFLDEIGGQPGDDALKNLEGMEDDAERVGTAIGNLAADALAAASNFVLGLQAIPAAWDSWINQLSGGVTNVRDFIGNAPIVGLSDDEAAAMRRAQAAEQARIDAALAALVNPPSTYDTGSRLDTFSIANLYRYNPRAEDASGRGDGRAAQKGARTRTRP